MAVLLTQVDFPSEETNTPGPAISSGRAGGRSVHFRAARSGARFRVPGGWATGVRDRKAANVEHIARTLARLKHQAEAAPTT
jgi:hypothetical protein